MPRNTASQRVAANVRAELARLNQSQTWLAENINRTQDFVSRRVSGKVPFDIEVLDQVAAALGVPMATLIGESEAVA